jgi:gas vesicle protein
MKEYNFVKGMTVGVLTGAAMLWAMMPPKKTNVRKAAGEALKAASQAMEDLSDSMGLR